MSFKDIKELIKECKENIKIIDNYYVPYDVKIEKAKYFSRKRLLLNFST